MTKLYTILNTYAYETKSSTTKKTVLVIKSTNRTETQKEIEKKLTESGITFLREKSSLSGSMQVTSIYDSTSVTILVYKPKSGGMTETTLNSTITELAPALGFMGGIKPKSVGVFYDYLKSVDHKNSKGKVYLSDRDVAAGKKFVNDFPTSSKFKEKMENAMGVLDYLYDENDKNEISAVYWGYREKPKGVDNKHKGDLFVEYATGKMIGVSLKAGSETSKEPKLNTYVNPIMEYLAPTAVDVLREELWSKIYKSFSVKKLTYDKRQDKKDTLTGLTNLENNNVDEYNRLYDVGLDIIRDALIGVFELDMVNTIKYLNMAIVGDVGDVPLLVIKAFNSTYKILTDEDDVSVFLPKVTEIKCSKSSTSKQDFYIELIASRTDKLKLKFAVRTNKSGDEHKLGQFFNLSVKFNGIV